ncbi:zinc-dependent metalloprotease, partial [Klebsiella pneumoniae]|uniref:zinc-dependent metalloprotease n=1 Tax=Klebsiella pneumoniae TaxID=573 RepID=UPI00200C651E
MGLVEGHAEWAMDAAGEDAVPGVKELRSKMNRRRADRAPLFKLLDRLLGFDLKMRQYEQGKAFCDAVERARGRRGIDSAWESAD